MKLNGDNCRGRPLSGLAHISEWDWNSINPKQSKLTPDEALNIEGLLTIKEIGSALKGMKHNKIEGIDSFPAEF